MIETEFSEARILISAAHFSGFGGAATAALDWLEVYRSLGLRCDFYGDTCHPRLLRRVQDLGGEVIPRAEDVHAFDYDLLHAQGYVLPLFDYQLRSSSRRSTLFAVAHLSTYSKGSAPGLVFEPLLGNVTLANSEETAAYLRGLKLGLAPALSFNNAAPMRWSQRVRRRRRMSSVVIVSNHIPPELNDAVPLLRAQGIEVAILGQGYDYRLINEYMLVRHDAIITIGKTVQYALLARIPVYVYDRYGGPGYLAASNIEAAQFFNFSGRCCRRQVTAEQIAREVIDGHAPADEYLRSLPEQALDAFRLETYARELLVMARDNGRTNVELSEIMSRDDRIRCEADLCTMLSNARRGLLVARRRLDRIASANADLVQGAERAEAEVTAVVDDP